jgi:hypothetical protein
MNQSLAYEFAAVMPTVVETGLMRSTCTFLDRIGGATPQQDSMGQLDETLVPVTGLEDLVCMFGVARNSPAFLPDEGRRMATHNIEEPEYHLILTGYFAAVIPRFYVQINGDATTTYEITPGTMQHDSQIGQTRCKLRRFSY